MRWGILAIVLVGGHLAGCAGEGDPKQDTGDGRLVMVSGRDDHGLVSLDRVPLYDAPEGDREVGRVHDGTLVRVVERRGMAMRVATLEGKSVSGWIDDFYLRGQLRLVGPPPECRSRIGGSEVEGGTLVLVYDVRGGHVIVETLGRPGEKSVHGRALRAHLQELPPQGQKCGADPEGSMHVH